MRMRIWIILTAGLALHSLAPAQTRTPITDAGRRATLRLDNAARVVEATSSGQNIEQVFTLSNTGSAPLTLEIERTSCGCVAAVLSSQTVAPGHNATLTFKMQAGNWGSKTETVLLRTNDAARPQITLTVQAKMPPAVVPNPARLALETTEGQPIHRFISLLLPEGASLGAIVTRQPFVSAQAAESQTVSGGTLQRIRVSIADSAPVGTSAGEILFELKNAPVPRIGVPFTCLVEPDIQVEPASIFLGQALAGSTLRKTVIVTSRSGRPFNIAAVQAKNHHLTAQANPDVVAASHAVEVRLKTVGEAGLVVQETLEIKLSNGRVLEVPVVGMIAKAGEATAVVAQAAILQVGAPAPDFTATDMNGNPWELSALRGKKHLLLTFFPKCFTGGCAGRLASLQRQLRELEAADVQVLAVSVDSAQEQRAFAAQLGLQFPLIPDVERTLCLLYAAAQDKSDLAARQSVMIDKNGLVRWIDSNIQTATHGADVLSKMRESSRENAQHPQIDEGAMLAVLGVQVGRRMIGEIHFDDDAVEPVEFRQTV